MDISLPKDMIKIIDQLIIYEDMLERERVEDFQYEYAYIEDPFERIEGREIPTIIKIPI